MKAGRELDLLVAEKIFGLKYGFNQWKGEMPRNNEEAYGIVRRYSTDISAAWEVVEKMKEFNPFNTIDIFVRKDFVEVQINSWKENADKSRTLSESSQEEETFPLALCLAALKALGVNIDE